MNLSLLYLPANPCEGSDSGKAVLVNGTFHLKFKSGHGKTFARLSKSQGCMKKTVLSVLTLVMLTGLFSGCARAPAPANTPTPVPPTRMPSATDTPPVRLTATSPTLVYAEPFDGIVATLEVSDPKSLTYNPNSSAFAAFPQAVRQLAARNAPENNGASMLAYALTFPRPDSYLAAQALITLGPDWTMTTAPILFDSLLDPRARVRLYALLALGTVGRQGACAVGHIGPLLWDPDPYVRSAAAQALSSITEKDLLPAGHEFTPQPLSESPVLADIPKGTIAGMAKKWWNDQG